MSLNKIPNESNQMGSNSNEDKHIPNLQRHQSEQYHSSYLCRSIIEINKLPLELKCISKTSIFLKQLRKHVNED